MKVNEIIDELNLENGSKYKMSVLKKYEDNELLKELLQMTYDKVKYTYGVSMKNIPDYTPQDKEDLGWALELLREKFTTREITGKAAIRLLTHALEMMSKESALILERVINRDQRINLGKTNMNKVWKNLITKPPYMRCSQMKNLKRISYEGGAIAQLKEDGTYRSVIIDGEDITVISRSGEEDDFPSFKENIKGLPNGVYIGELLIESLPGMSNRAKANGLINSDTEQEDMYFSTWDYVTLDEWAEKLSKVKYGDRLKVLEENIQISRTYLSTQIKVVEGKIVYSEEEAKDYYKELVGKGYEGIVLKDLGTLFKDHTSPTQIKFKEEAVAEFIITGFDEGEGRLKDSLGAMHFISSCSKVKGRMSGFTDDIRKEIWNNQSKYLDTICSVKYNGVSQAKGNEYFALMFPQFDDFRPDKTEADDLEYIKNALN